MCIYSINILVEALPIYNTYTYIPALSAADTREESSLVPSVC